MPATRAKGAIAQYQEQERRRKLLEKQRARAIQAAQRLRECPSTCDAAEKLCSMFADRKGPASFDSFYRREFKHLFNALWAGLRDGIV